MKKKSIPERIAELVRFEDLTSEQIAVHFTLNNDPKKNLALVRSYINRAKDDYNLIEVVRKKGRINYYGNLEEKLELVKELELVNVNQEIRISFYAQKYLKELYTLTELTKENSEIMKKIERFFGFLEIREKNQFEVIV